MKNIELKFIAELMKNDSRCDRELEQLDLFSLGKKSWRVLAFLSRFLQ